MDTFRLSEQESSFKELAARAHLRGLRANGVLAMDKYQVLMVDAPDVPVEELRAAVKWKIRDLIDFHIDDVAIDVFDVPTRTATSPSRSLYVVAARSSAVRGLVDKLFEAGLEIGAIDIVEMALRNLAFADAGEDERLVTLYLERDRGVIVLSHGATLYFTRQLDLGYAGVGDPQVNARLTLEIQRSLDYCDSHLDFGRPSRVAVIPFGAADATFLDALSADIGLPADYFDLARIVAIPEPIGEFTPADWIALGGALRMEERKL
jgi:MSHA biogenesis protein MshI